MWCINVKRSSELISYLDTYLRFSAKWLAFGRIVYKLLKMCTGISTSSQLQYLPQNNIFKLKKWENKCFEKISFQHLSDENYFNFKLEIFWRGKGFPKFFSSSLIYFVKYFWAWKFLSLPIYVKQYFRLFW